MSIMAAELGVLLCLVALAMANSCPTWFTNSTGNCKCDQELNGYVNCNQNTYRVDVRMGWCITLFNNTLEDLVVAGACPYNYASKASNATSRVYSSVPSDPTQLNAAICGPYSREGLFCGHCSEGFGPSPSSFRHCSNCTDITMGYAISLYLFLELFPITIFFFFVILFHFNVTSGPMLGYVIFCHAHVITSLNNFFIYTSILSHLPSFLAFIFHSSLVLSGIWTLKFFQFIAPPFCISSKMTDIHIHMLSFVTILYPQFLVLFTYIVMELHIQDSKCLSIMWKPFYRYLAKFNGKMNISNSIIHAFATFISLSLAGVVYGTYSIITGSIVYDVNGSVITNVLYFDPTIVQYSSDHIPYMVIALLFLLLLVLCPALLLCLYPTRLYEKLSQCVSARKRIVVKTFAETFQGCFKDGLGGTVDYRMIPGIMFLSGGIAALAVSFTDASSSRSPFSTAVIVGCVCTVISVVLSYLRPCKSLLMNVSLSFHFTLIGIAGIMVALWDHDSFISTETLAVAFAVLMAIPHILMVIWVAYNISSHICTKCQCYQKWSVLKYLSRIHCSQHELRYLLPKERDNSQ